RAAQMTWYTSAGPPVWHTRIFREELARHTDFIPFETSELSRDRVGIQALRNLTWNYTNGFMNIALAPSGHVSSIIGVPLGNWQQFDGTNLGAGQPGGGLRALESLLGRR